MFLSYIFFLSFRERFTKSNKLHNCQLLQHKVLKNNLNSRKLTSQAYSSHDIKGMSIKANFVFFSIRMLTLVLHSDCEI